MKFVLLVVINATMFNANGIAPAASVTMQTFENETACKQAQQQLAAMVSEVKFPGGAFRAQCVPAGLPVN